MRTLALAPVVVLVCVAAARPSDFRLQPRTEPGDVAPMPQLARIADVRAILDEIAMPPLPFGQAAAPPRFPYLAERMRHYGPDGTIGDVLKSAEKYPFRAGVLQAVRVVRRVPIPGDPKGTLSLVQIESPLSDKAKGAVAKVQDIVAVATAELELELESLAELEKLRADEPRRWQSHYDYTVAQLRRRLVAIHEYNKALSDIRTESMPDLPAGSPGWRLAPTEQLRSRAEVKKLHKLATEGFRTIAADCKGTPWEPLANHALLAQPGLVWEPVVK